MVQTPLVAFSCPTRRPPVTHPVEPENDTQMSGAYGNYVPGVWFSVDYAANAGTMLSIRWTSGPTSFADAAQWTTTSANGTHGFYDMSKANGICAERTSEDVRSLTAPRTPT